MDRTPTAGKHYEILDITGDAYSIEKRGIEIESLGQQMTAAADLLDKIALGAECRGKSLDSIKDAVGDMTGDLRKAGERYTPSGTAILEYARVLDGVQSSLRTLMPRLEQTWTTYETTKGQYETDSQLPEPEDGEEDDRTTASDVTTDRTEWENAAREYEGVYDTWWEAYEAARTGIKEANDNGVEDSLLDNALPALELLGDILSYAGIVLAVAACILGGPFILAAALVGLAALAVTCLKVAGGRGGALDIVMAAVGVFPFGKAFAAFKLVKLAGPGGRLAALGRGLLDMGGDMVGVGWRNGSRLAGVLENGTLARVLHEGGNLNRNGTRVLRNFFNGLGDTSLGSRLLLGNQGAAQHMISDAASGLSNKAFNNLTTFLNNTPGGHVMQDMLSPGSPALDFMDNLGKASTGFGYDRATGGWGFGL